jgi:hypothetical protein
MKVETPFCPPHAALEECEKLELEVGNDCVACSLNERSELLNLLEPFAADGNSEDSCTVLRKVIDLRKETEVGLNLFRQLVSGKNGLRTLGAFPCNVAEHESVDCECFWEQCEAWAKQDANPSTQSAADGLVDEVQRRMDQVVEAAVEWHQAGREGAEWFDKAEALGAAIDSLLELRSKPKTATSQ